MSVLIDLHFLPSLEYFCAIAPFQNIAVEMHEHWVKQSLRNRCYLLTSQGAARMTVPLTGISGKVVVRDVQIGYGSNWQANFWRTLETAYAKAPYFQHYADDLRKEIFSNRKFLFDLNLQILSMCLQWLRWDKNISETDKYEKEVPPDTHDLRDRISAKRDFQERGFYLSQPYQQVFGSGFVPNLSLVDLVFCEGPQAAGLISASQTKK